VEPVSDEFPVVSLEGADTPWPADRVCSVQHPGGGPKKIPLNHSLVRFVDDEVIQYRTNTAPGSSGVPVFVENCNVVAIHRRSVSATEDDLSGVRTEGVRAALLIEGMKALGVCPLAS
jgi:hypothetical protein